MLKLADLASRADFEVGPLRVSPSRRLVEGPAGSTNVEPIVMKVFLLLLEAGGSVVTRDELFGNAWGGVFVGDDSLNRAIARVRKIANETAPGLFELETIPRTGYRLTGPILDHLDAPAEPAPVERQSLSRRTMVGAGAAASIAALGGGWWITARVKDQRRFEDLFKRARERMEYGDDSRKATELIRQAVALRPDDPTAQGLLAFALADNADNVNTGTGEVAMESAEEAAGISLRADPAEPNARLALMQLQRATLNLTATEDRLRAVLATAPDNFFAMRLLWNLLQSAGRSREALALVERAISIRPRAADNNYPLAQLLWINGHVAEADRVIDRAIRAWPMHRFVRFARFTIFAFTGRPRAALAMLDDPSMRPQSFPPDAVALWRIGLPTLDQPTAANIARTRKAYVDAIKQSPKLANYAVLVLSALGEVDTAFDIANEFLVFRPSGTPSPGKTKRAGSGAWAFTPWLFVPPVASMRADPRFSGLCDGIGLTAYWRARGIRPDYELG